ncbi:nardilysin-like isoform X1 [Acipenser ruthenus]|uniref:nardilysin-like isoform X1 n=1 Tax=Acipenser ruthenus TaxID=7906 RepID=UPI00145B0F88|nr:nardilysin-like isoform X1 [Acipenser ruthenus]XP_058887818.1 nardilysin-like isoform X1 [Acipenser ruthenus]
MPVTNMVACAESAQPSQPEPNEDPVQHPAEARDKGASGDRGGGESPVDSEIVKSPSDPKHYRYIKLDNGLQALLISDLSSTDGNPSDSEEEEGDLEEDGSGDEDAAEEDGDSGEGTEESEHGEDEQDSDFEELEDESDLKKKKSCSEKQSAAALCVGVGSFSDPDDLPGLAHFLEHMVFMGSEKYPAENGFDAFLKKHGGSDNASTDCERTVFQFDVQRKHFREALDRWAQFFISPLMIKDAIGREVEAVDSEYQLARPSDSHRKEMLFGSLAKPGHPMGKFCWGNAQTLKHEPKEKNIDTYVRLREFWEQHYSAHYMTLAVQSKESLDTLEEWVREIFSKIPNNSLPKPNFSHLVDPFDTPAFNKLYRVVPVRKIHALTITWALLPQEHHYRVKPLHFISWLIGHEGTGSILSLLRKKCWALALYGGNSETGFDQNSTYSIFGISITLTDEGYRNYYQIAHLVFQYLKMLQKSGPQQRIYDEIQKIQDNEFHYQEQTDPIDYVENVCENMQLFRKPDILTGDQLMFEYKPEVISAVLNLLVPDTANLLLLSPNNEGSCPLKEKWFGTQYSVQDIEKEWSERWSGDFELNPDLHLPAENKFIATDFNLKTSDCPDTEYPVRIINNEKGCLWYKKDNKFKIPKAYVRFNLISPLIQKSPENLVLFDIFVNILAHNLAEPAYEADVAQLEYKLVAGEHGFVIKVKGFNHKLPLLFNLIIDYLADFTASPDVFSMIAEQLKKTYFNILIKPDKLGKDARLLILEHSRWSMIQKYQAIMKGLSVESLMSFVGKLKSQLYAEGMVQGNFTSREAMEFLHYVIQKLQFQRLSVEVPVHFRVVELPKVPHLCKVKSLNKGDANSEVTVYYQSGPRNLREHTLMELLVMHMEEPCFDFLRTKETLGYHVYPTCRNTSGVLGFSVTVETQATKFNTEEVDKKIEEFLTGFGEKMASVADEAFKAQVVALIKLKECEDTHLGEEVDRNWYEVVTQQYVFDRLNREIEALKLITKSELVSCFMEHRGSGSKKLSMHVVGYGEEEKDTASSSSPSDLQSSSYGEVSQLTFLPVSPIMADVTAITDIRAFTSTLHVYPFHKILK